MKALIIVDMQNDFIDGALGTPEAQAIVSNVVNKMKKHKNTDTIILFTKDTHKENYLDTPEGKKLPIPHCIEGTLGWSIAKPIASEFKADGYMTYSSGTVANGRVLKPTFGSYDLLKILDSDEIELDEIELCGVCTDICVISNAIMIKNFFPDIPVIVDASCCAGVTPQKHTAALEVMKSCQIDVIGE